MVRNSADRYVRASKARVKGMYSRHSFEETSTSIASLGRRELKCRIKNFRGRFRLDFTDDYLDSASLEKLRHILLAALLTAKV